MMHAPTMAGVDFDHVLDATTPETQAALVESHRRAAELETMVADSVPAPSRKRKVTPSVAALPPRHDTAATSMYVVHADGKAFGLVLVALGCMGDDIVLDFEADGLYVRQEHKSHTIIAELFLPASVFAVYEMPQAYTHVLFYKDLAAFVGTFTEKASLALYTLARVNGKASPYDDVLIARAYVSATNDVLVYFRYMEPETRDVTKIKDVPISDWKHPARVTLDASLLQKHVKACIKQKGFVVELRVTRGVNVLEMITQTTTRTEIGTSKRRVPVDSVDVIDVTVNRTRSHVVALEFLAIVTAVASVTDSVTLLLGTVDKPVYLRFERAGKVTIDVLVCPDSSGGLDSDDDDKDDEHAE